jgi:hypothetical protein
LTRRCASCIEKSFRKKVVPVAEPRTISATVTSPSLV